MIVAASRARLAVPRPTGWQLFVVLLVIALGSEYWDKNPMTLGGRLQIPWPRFILAMLALPLIIPPRAWRWSTLLRIPAPLGPLMAFWACCGLSIVNFASAPRGFDVLQFTKTFAHLTMYVVFVFVVVKWITWPRLFLLVRAYYLLGIVAALVSLLQFIYGALGWFHWLEPLRLQSAEYTIGEGLTTGFRASSVFGEPSWAARYYIHFIALALAFWWRTRDRRHLAALTLFLFAFYTANSLLGYVILGGFVLAIGLAQMWRRNMFSLTPRQKVAAAVATYAVFVVWVAGVSPRFPDLIERSITRVRLIPIGGGGAGNRIDGVFAGIEVWKIAPVLGVGLGHIDRYIVEFYQDPTYVLRSRYASDSVYVQLLAETGIAGLVAFLWFWGRLLLLSAAPQSARHASPRAAQVYAWLRLLQIDLLAQAVGMAASSDYLNPHLWTVVAIVLGCKVLIVRDGRVSETITESPVVSLSTVPGFAV